MTFWLPQAEAALAQVTRDAQRGGPRGHTVLHVV